MNIKKSYKPTVSGIILDSKNMVLLTHNKDHGPDFWKFPQGGVERGESEKQAIIREMIEELNARNLEFLKKSKIKTKYTWPRHVQEKKGFIGPKISYFIFRYKNNNKLTPNQEELDDIKWIEINNLKAQFQTLPEFQLTLEKLIQEIHSLNA